MPRFLGLKTYLTTNRSSISKQDAARIRRSRMSSNEILRENIADRLKCPLCFCLPCFTVVTVMLAVVIVYVTNPYIEGLNFYKTECTVINVAFSKKGSCSLKTERFNPCYKIMVEYNTTSGIRTSVLMENEQTLYHCEKCSYTFGKGSVFTKSKCLNSQTCLETFDEKFRKSEQKYPCFYDPEKPEDVFREYKISRAEAIYQTSLPAIFIFLFIVAFGFVQYDELKRRKLNKQIQVEKHRRPKINHETYRPKADVPSCSSDSFESPGAGSSLGSAAAMYRVRKKKMPCAKRHAFYTRDMEDVIMEEKPISLHVETRTHGPRDQFMQVNVDKVTARCACVGHTSFENHFELSRHQKIFKPVMSSQHYYRNQLQRSATAFRYLPESSV